MKHLNFLCLLLLFSTLKLSAQSYFPFSIGKTSYFNSNLGLFAVVPLDSEVNAWPKHYSFKPHILPTNFTIPNPYLCAAKVNGSIMGIRVSNYGDSIFEFYNSFNLPITLKINTQIGQTWQAYADTNATVSFKHTKDSTTNDDTIQIITIEVQRLNSIYDNEDYLPILLSSKHGLIEFPAFYSFPFSLNVINDINPKNLTKVATSTHNITWDSIYNFVIGDEFHIQNRRGEFGKLEVTNTIYEIVETYRPNPDSLSFKTLRYSAYSYNTFDSSSHSFIVDTFYLNYKRNAQLDEETAIYANKGKPYLVINNEHGLAKQPYINSRVSSTIADSCLSVSFESPDYYFTDQYINGLGGPYGDFGSSSRKLTYYKKSNQTWGVPFSKTVGINTISSQINVSVFPNPATETLTIQLQQPTKAQITLYDYTGKLIDTYTITEAINQLNISVLKPGIYLYVIKGNYTSTSGKFIKQD